MHSACVLTPGHVPVVFIGKSICLFQEREKAGSGMSIRAAVCSRSWTVRTGFRAGLVCTDTQESRVTGKQNAVTRAIGNHWVPWHVVAPSHQIDVLVMFLRINMVRA